MGAILGIFGEVTEAEIERAVESLGHRGKQVHIDRSLPRVTLATVTEGDRGESGIVHEGGFTIIADVLSFDPDSSTFPYGRTTDLLDIVRNSRERSLTDWNGHFAFGLWNSADHTLRLGRDLLGCKPLFYCKRDQGGFAFATEYKALLALNDVNPAPDLDMLQHLQCCKKLPAGRTLFDAVHAVEPGCIQSFGPAGDKSGVTRFPTPQVEVRYTSEKEACQAVQREVTEAVLRRIGKSDPIGIALSGGIDSILLACICRKHFPNREIHTFTAGYGDHDPELPTARFVASHIHAIHHEVLTPPQLILESLPRLVWHLEDPYARSEALQLYELGRAAAAKVGTLLSGQAADALFAGMPRHRILWLVQRLPFLRSALTDVYELTQSGNPPRYFAGKLITSAYFRRNIPPVPRIIGSSYRPKRLELPSGTTQLLNRFTCVGLQNGVSQDIPKFERSFGAFGLKYSSPFFDAKLIRFSYTVDDALKITLRRQKHILREAMRGIVPDEVLDVPKQPQRMSYDLEFSQALDQLVSKYLSPTRVNERGFFDPLEISKLTQRHPSKPYGAEWGMRLWTAVLTEIWAETFIDRRGQSAPEDAKNFPSVTAKVGR